jgi:hypothetical protein
MNKREEEEREWEAKRRELSACSFAFACIRVPASLDEFRARV